jgi:hypothetical protein
MLLCRPTGYELPAAALAVVGAVAELPAGHGPAATRLPILYRKRSQANRGSGAAHLLVLIRNLSEILRGGEPVEEQTVTSVLDDRVEDVAEGFLCCRAL